MNVQTATKLCRFDLMQRVEAGDFTSWRAEAAIDRHLTALSNERDRSILLYRLQDQLTFVDMSEQPEADACLWAVRALVSRRVRSGMYGPCLRAPRILDHVYSSLNVVTIKLGIVETKMESFSRHVTLDSAHHHDLRHYIRDWRLPIVDFLRSPLFTLKDTSLNGDHVLSGKRG